MITCSFSHFFISISTCFLLDFSLLVNTGPLWLAVLSFLSFFSGFLSESSSFSFSFSALIFVSSGLIFSESLVLCGCDVEEVTVFLDFFSELSSIFLKNHDFLNKLIKFINFYANWVFPPYYKFVGQNNRSCYFG